MKNQKNKDELKVITTAELKQHEGLSNVTNEDALRIIELVKQLAFITHNIVSNHE